MLTDAEILELEELLKWDETEKKRESLTIIDENTPKNYAFLHKSLTNQRYENEKLVDGFKGVVLEGSARSRKTFSVIDLIIYIGLYIDKKVVVTIVRETYNEIKTTLYNDFSNALDEYGLDNPFSRLKEVDSFKIGKCKITFIGADQSKKFEGLTSDIIYFNEAIPIDEIIIRKATMRCNWFWIIDYNPSVTQHYIFDKIITRPDVGFLRTTFRDNPLVPLGQKLEILGYEPWLPDSYAFNVTDGTIHYNGKPIDENNQPPPHPVNISAGTADEFLWKCYGLGLRGSMKGLIFPNVTYIDEFPDLAFDYGLDFGFTVDPCTITKCAEDEFNIYIEVLSYSPMETPEEIDQYMNDIGMDKKLSITADSSDRYTSEKNGAIKMVSALKEMGWNIHKVSKNKSVMYWLTSMKKKKIHFVRNHLVNFAKKEAENYRMKEINGISINQPIDKFNHCFTGDTLIETESGLKRIDCIDTNDLVLTSNGYEKVLELFHNGQKEIYSYWIDLGVFSLVLRSTKDHLIKTNEGWIQISKLKQGQTVYLSKSLTEELTNFIEEKSILAEDQKKCIGMYGNIMDLQGKKDSIFITKTETDSITPLKTLNWSMLENIFLNTLRKGTKKIRDGQKNSQALVLSPQNNGINQKKVLNGTEKTLLNAGSVIKHMEKENVRFVEMNLNQKQQFKDSAQTIVSQDSEVNQELITSQKNVYTAQMNSSQTNIQELDFAQKFVVQKIDSKKMNKEQVYDIAVNNTHEYFANGILVHNCFDSARYRHMALNSKQVFETNKSLSDLGVNY